MGGRHRSKQGFNTEFTEKQFKPRSCTEFLPSYRLRLWVGFSLLFHCERAALRRGRARPCHPRTLCGTRWRMMPVQPGANGEGEPGHDAGLCRPDRRMIYNSFLYRKLLQWPRAATLICQVCMNYMRSGARRVADADWPKTCRLITSLPSRRFDKDFATDQQGCTRIRPDIRRLVHAPGPSRADGFGLPQLICVHPC